MQQEEIKGKILLLHHGNVAQIEEQSMIVRHGKKAFLSAMFVPLRLSGWYHHMKLQF